MGHAYRKGGLDLPFDTARGREVQRHLGGESWKNRTGVNVWGFLTVDAARGIVYLPLGAPSVDQYGGDRPGDNLFANSLVAVDANTGKYLWHFQIVHHDLWDADLTGAPALIDVKQGGKTIPAVVAYNKLGLLFLLDRVTGKPIFGAEERPVPASDVPLGTGLQDTAVSAQTATVGAHVDEHGGCRHRNARIGSGMQEVARGRAIRRTVLAADV
ncbi:MAG: hypothetical protein WDO73_01875 [Ignavibacteriota bacterium]